MADVAPQSHSRPTATPNLLPPSIAIPGASTTPHKNARIHGLTLDTFSPVTQSGSYDFDRIIKQGEVLKRTRKTKVCLG